MVSLRRKFCSISSMMSTCHSLLPPMVLPCSNVANPSFSNRISASGICRGSISIIIHHFGIKINTFENYRPDELHAVGAAVEREEGVLPALVDEALSLGVRDVGRIRRNEVETPLDTKKGRIR